MVTKTKRILRLLVIDDSPDDADALAKSLRIARFMLKTKRVTDAAGLQGALTNSKWDVVIAEHKLHGLKSRNAFDLVRGNHPDLPFIIYTSDISDEETIDLMNSGVRDVIHKSRNARIVPVISRELSVLEEKKEHLRALRATKEIEDKHRTMVEGSHEAVAYMLDGLHVEVNHAYLSLFGYEKFAEVEVLPVLDLIDKASQADFKSALRKTNKNIKLDGPVELAARKKDDSIINLEATLAQVDLKGEKCIQITVSDVSKRKAAENRLQYLSQRDPLTGLYNRHHFVRLLDEAIHSAKKNTGVLLYINLYDLKNIIQSLGYTAGDRMLLKITKLLRDTLGSDTELARLGSDDFAVIYKDMNQADGTKMAQKLEKVITKSPITEKGENYFCHFISSITPLSGGENALALLTQAQTACEQDMPEVSIPEPKPATQTTAPPPAQDHNVVPFAETNEPPDNRIELEQAPAHLSVEK
ncbi:MAG: diguanylate cyclase domain-containing protein, partial [Acidiferrobacterales bacterium]